MYIVAFLLIMIRLLLCTNCIPIIYVLMTLYINTVIFKSKIFVLLQYNDFIEIRINDGNRI